MNDTYLYDGLDENGNPDGENHEYYTGRLTRILFPMGYESYVYDSWGRITGITVNIDGRIRATTLTYDEVDRIKTETLPTGEVLIYYRGEDGNIVSINGEELYASDIAYTAYGKLQQICYGNGIITTYDYYDDATVDPSNDYRTKSFHLREILIEDSDGIEITKTGYEYDEAGNLKVKRLPMARGTSIPRNSHTTPLTVLSLPIRQNCMGISLIPTTA